MAASLVTGGAGFLGCHVARHRLDAGDDVVVLDDLSGGSVANVPDGVELVRANVSDADAVRDVFAHHAFDYVFHLAAYAAEGLSHYIRRFNYTNNIVGSMTVINECIEREVRCLVFTSSIAVYGSLPPPVTEDTPPRPEDPYGIAKLAVEQDLAAARELFGLDSIVFRPHNVYGEGQNIADPYRNVVGIFMNQVMRGLPMTIFGDGEQTRAFSYVDDVAPAIARSVETPAAIGRVFNIGSDTPHTVNRVAELVAASFDVEPELRHVAPRREARHIWATHDLVNRVLGAGATTDLADGIDRMATWARSIEAPIPSRFSDIEVTRGLPPIWTELRDQGGSPPIIS